MEMLWVIELHADA